MKTNSQTEDLESIVWKQVLNNVVKKDETTMSRPFFLFYIIKRVYNYIKIIGGLPMQNIVYLTSLTNRIDKGLLDSQMATFLKGLEGEAIIYQKLKRIDDLSFLYNIELNINNRVQIDF